MLRLCLLAALLLRSPLASLQLCTDGTPRQCQEAEFAPGSTLAGEGFDITRMERKGAFVLDMNRWRRKDKTCVLCSNPYMDNAKQKLPLSVLDWRAKHSCSAKVSGKLFKSSESLVQSSASSVQNDWRVGLELDLDDKGGSAMLAGTKSKLSEYVMEKTKSDRFSFSSNSMSCEFYSYRVSSAPKIHQEFHKALSQLPKVYNAQHKPRFHKLFENFGTHYITKVKMGGTVESVTSIRQCEASLQGLTTEEVQMCLEAEASASLKVKASVETKHCESDSSKLGDTKTFSDRFSDRFTETKGGHTTEPDLLYSASKDPSAYREWMSSLARSPDIVSYSLDPLHELLPPGSDQRKNLRLAIKHYILERGLWRNCSSQCRAGAGTRSDSRDPCVCHCHHQQSVNPDCCPTRRGMARVVITLQRAADLWGDNTTPTDGYVKVFVNSNQLHRTHVVDNNNDPRWGDIVDLGVQDLSSPSIVRFEVWDQDSGWDDDRLGQCERALTAGAKQDVCALERGRFYFRWEVTCAPSLGGETCTDYRPSPMSEELSAAHVSRHARPIPGRHLEKMGVFVDERESRGNWSAAAAVKRWKGI